MSSVAPAWATVSKWGLGAALLYVAAGVYLIHDDYTHQGGGWISLRGMLTDLVVAPISFLAEKLGWPWQPLNPLHAGAALLICAVLIYTIAASIEAFVRGIRAT